MKNSKKSIVTLSAASLLLGASSLVASPDASASPVAFSNLGSAAKVRSSILAKHNPYGILMNEEKDGGEGKCGENKCGEGKCGDEDGTKKEGGEEASE